MELKSSPYQNNIYSEIRDTKNSLLIQAGAGSGKTTTILNCLDLIPKADNKIIFIAFNRNIATELRERAPKHVHVSTLHSFGFNAILTWFGKVKMNEDKLFWIAMKMFDKWRVEENRYSYIHRVRKLVDYMRVNMVYSGETEIFDLATKYSLPVFSSEIDHAIELLDASNKASYKEIDYTDMIHIPAFKNLKLRKHEFVFLDEAQDTNRAQQVLISNMIHPTRGRLICVGDRYQSIYGFAGADSVAFESLASIRPNTVELPLSICYRCAQAIVREAQKYCPYIEADPNQIEGVVREGGAKEVQGDCFVLCRNTKPLIEMLFFLLGNGIKSNVKGKEIGDNIISFIKKTRQKTTKKLIKHLEVNKIKLNRQLTEKGVKNPKNHPSMVELAEKCDIIIIMAERFETCNQLIKYIESVFLDEEVEGVMLMTIHKAKGLEKKKVFFLNPELIPSQYAYTDDEKQQEENLMYVGITRAKEELVYIRYFTIR